MLLTGAWRLATMPSKANEACPMLLECHIKTAEHPISMVVLTHPVRGHIGVVIPKLGSNQRTNGKTQLNRPIKFILCKGWDGGLADYDTAKGQRSRGLGVIAVHVINT